MDTPSAPKGNLRAADFAASHCLDVTVGCLEDKPKDWDHPGKFKCKSCQATSDKKKKLCKPLKIEKKKP